MLYNPIYDGLGQDVYKLGMTKDLKSRMNQYVTCYPAPSEYKYAKRIDGDIVKCEKIVFNELKDYRIVKNREFFKCNLRKIEEVMDLVEELAKGGYEMPKKAAQWKKRDAKKEHMEVNERKVKLIHDDCSDEMVEKVKGIFRKLGKDEMSFPMKVRLSVILRARKDIIPDEDELRKVQKMFNIRLRGASKFEEMSKRQYKQVIKKMCAAVGVDMQPDGGNMTRDDGEYTFTMDPVAATKTKV